MIEAQPDLLAGVPRQLFIGGRWVDGAADDRIEVTDPSTESVVATVAGGAVDDGLAAVAAAQDALPGWARTPSRERGEILRRAFELMTERSDELARVCVIENGKTLADARAEVAYAAEFFRWYAEEAVRLHGSIQTAPGGTNKILTMRQPIGVAVLVTPWNFPLAMATRKIGPALAAGCTIVLKPASETPLSALAIAQILAEAGAPAGTVNVVCSKRSGAVVGAMVDDPRVRKLSFTGSTEVGRVLLARAAQTVVNCSMELGGNAPFVVFNDADLDAAVTGAMIAKMRNGGEACTAANRFYVQAGVVDDFSEAFAARMKALRIGSGLEPDVDLGPLVNAESRDKVASLVAGAVAVGAELRTGGGRPDRRGYFYEPTVLTGVPVDAPVLREEIFGPVAPIVSFRTEQEAVAAANDTEFGLVSYVYTSDLARGLRVSEALDTGMVGLNRGVVSDPAAPFGGTKQSGLGREGGHEGMLEYTEEKYVATDW
ncbi:NAD-dependent succinate-semialdehyde dehydrogenase [Kribbella sp. CA-253562]|uniref:NAD-dependent succinate-semialdehyde dehydrogenase n=1 Tax=Kribbella sp. CA-253562 TaxID=3239942 RepID=UPI003D8C5E44